MKCPNEIVSLSREDLVVLVMELQRQLEGATAIIKKGLKADIAVLKRSARQRLSQNAHG